MNSTAPRRLVLLRHAKAEHPQIEDRLRPLALKGRTQAGGGGASLSHEGLVPDHVVCSAAIRTRQTWDLARAALSGEPESVDINEDLYLADVRRVLEIVREIGDDVATVLVVGHEPVMSQTAATLAGPGSDEAVLDRVRLGVPTASYSVLETDARWSELEPDGARLVRLVTPA
ncbi:SixA phosphatase family protein [Cellulomonas timonensis]|uniref:SixA phosphatase family protein n=1 Tax=Cellulomonas timonensis TaxID=1689271 RepID=UPI00083273C7|nr:histidine phosphatase family protein [Cellulomonas timonensis]